MEPYLIGSQEASFLIMHTGRGFLRAPRAPLSLIICKIPYIPPRSASIGVDRRSLVCPVVESSVVGVSMFACSVAGL